MVRERDDVYRLILPKPFVRVLCEIFVQFLSLQVSVPMESFLKSLHALRDVCVFSMINTSNQNIRPHHLQINAVVPSPQRPNFPANVSEIPPSRTVEFLQSTHNSNSGFVWKFLQFPHRSGMIQKGHLMPHFFLSCSCVMYISFESLSRRSISPSRVS